MKNNNYLFPILNDKFLSNNLKFDNRNKQVYLRYDNQKITINKEILIAIYKYYKYKDLSLVDIFKRYLNKNSFFDDFLIVIEDTYNLDIKWRINKAKKENRFNYKDY